MNLNDLIKLQTAFDKKHTASESFYIPISGTNPRDLEHLVVCMLGELGEFANILKKVIRGDFEFEEAKPDLHEELTDILIYLLKIAGQANFDLEAGYVKKLQKNEDRFAHWKKE